MMMMIIIIIIIAAVVLVFEYGKKGRLAIVAVIHLRDTVFNSVVRA